MLGKCSIQYAKKFGKLSSGHRTGKGKFSFQSPLKRQCQIMFKLLYNCTHLTRYKVMLKVLQARLQQYMNWEFPDVQGLRKGRGTRDTIANFRWIKEKQENSRKTSTCASLTMLKTLRGSQQTMKNSWRDGNNRLPYLPPEKSVCRSGNNN